MRDRFMITSPSTISSFDTSSSTLVHKTFYHLIYFFTHDSLSSSIYPPKIFFVYILLRAYGHLSIRDTSSSASLFATL